jgi:hypothetical protein
MRIQEHILNQTNPSDAVSISKQASFVQGPQVQKANAIDISSIVMDDDALRGQGMTVQDVMQEAGGKDISTLRDYMTVMSNFMSDEDYAELVKEGKRPGAMEATEMVTSLDKIKATLASAGVDIAGFTDTLDRSTLEEMYGDSRSVEISEQLHKHDIPSTEENIESVSKTVEEGSALTDISEEAKKYIVRNDVELTVNNVYRSQFSAGNQAGKVSKGYYREGLSGYLSKKPESLDWAAIEGQAKEIIKRAGYEGNDQELLDAKWLVEKGLPLKEETFSKLQEVNALQIPGNEDGLIQNIATALANGKIAENTLLTGEINLFEEAVRIKEEVEKVDLEKLRNIPENQVLTIRNVIQLSGLQDKQQGTISETSALRQMEEIRLSMTVEANYRLLRSGFSLETESLENVIDQLKSLEEKEAETLNLQKQEFSLYKETLVKKEAIFSMPLGTIGRLGTLGRASTINQVYEEGLSLQRQYIEANEKYEPLATEVRPDLGDSIRKAFSNVDELLSDLGLENIEENQKAVRILGYNQMEVTEENIYKVKDVNLSVTNCIEKMTPSKVLQMIRDEINPLETSMDELENIMDQYSDEDGSKWDQYARFLQQAESRNDVNAEEREAYIGIYRMLRQVEKTDGAVIGSLMNQGAEISLKNLLSAVRTRKQGSMDYEINESFGGVETKASNKASISDQIEGYYNKLVIKMADQMEIKNPEEMNLSMDMSLEKAAETLEQFSDLFEGSERVFSEEAKSYRQVISTTEEYVFESLDAYEQPVTVDNLNAMNLLLNDRRSMYRKLSSLREEFEDVEFDTDLEQVIESMSDAFTSSDSVNEAFEDLEKVMKEMVSHAMDIPEYGRVDHRAISSLYKQISLTTNLAKEENYEVPVKIGDELTSINLRVLRQTEEKGKVYINTETDAFGKVMAEFSVSSQEVRGYVTTENEASAAYFREMSARMEVSLSEDGSMKVKIEVVTIEAIQVEMIARQGLEERLGLLQNEADTDNQVATSRLYLLAKLFLEEIGKEVEIDT